jgi:hypothetical protein
MTGAPVPSLLVPGAWGDVFYVTNARQFARAKKTRRFKRAKAREDSCLVAKKLQWRSRDDVPIW